MTRARVRIIVARLFVFACFSLSAALVVWGVFSAKAAQASLKGLGFGNLRDWQAAFLGFSPWAVCSLVSILLGLGALRLYGRARIPHKVAAKSAVGCLLLICAFAFLWTVVSTCFVIFTRDTPLKFLVMNIQDDPGSLLTIITGFFIFDGSLVIVTLFVWYNFIRITPDDRSYLFATYRSDLLNFRQRNTNVDFLKYAQDETLHIIGILDTGLKGQLLTFLSDGGFLTGQDRLNLHNCDFRGVNLRHRSLPYADLTRINLEGADLSYAILFHSTLASANLRMADLGSTNLSEADLSKANLLGANLLQTDLRNAVLIEAQVSSQNLLKSRLSRATLPDGTIHP